MLLMYEQLRRAALLIHEQLLLLMHEQWNEIQWENYGWIDIEMVFWLLLAVSIAAKGISLWGEK